jgi:outer membrane protein assembly factor BamB
MNPSKFVFQAIVACLCIVAVAAQSTALQPPDAESLRRGARLGDAELVKQSLDAKVDVNGQTEYGVTALSLACNHGHIEVVQLLLDRGADPNIKDKFYGVGPLGWAISRDRIEIVKLLVAAKASDMDSSLATAVASNNLKLVEAILPSETLTLEGLKAAWKSAKSSKLDEIVALIESKLPEAERPEIAKPKMSAEELKKLQDIVGSYKNEAGNKLIFSMEEEQLVVRGEEDSQKFPLTATEADQFETNGMKLTFKREADKVVSFQLKIGERLVSYVREGATSTASFKPVEPSATAEPIVSANVRPDFPLDSNNWPGFRGTLSRGVSSKAEIPIQWDGASGQNIAWKTAIDGLATSSPVVWEGKVYMTTAIRESDQRGFRVGPYGDVESEEFDGECIFQVLCLSLDTGEILWKKQANKAFPKVKRHAKSSHANPTPVTDGRHLIVSFGGDGMYAYSIDGQLLWDLNLGMLDSGWFYDPTYQWGFGSSPAIFEDMVIFQCDVQEGSFIVAVDIATGKQRWRVPRNEIPTWGSPVGFVDSSGQPTIVVSGTKESAAYDAKTGEKLWALGGFSEIVVPTPQVTPHSIVLASGYAPVQPIVSLSHSARGELKMPADKKGSDPFQWNVTRGGPYMPTPVIFQERLYVLDNSGILSCFSMQNGTRLYRKRIRNNEATAFTASPVIAGEHLFAISEIGISFVVKLGTEAEVVATNTLGEAVLASPAISGTKLLIRGEKHLYAIEAKR